MGRLPQYVLEGQSHLDVWVLKVRPDAQVFSYFVILTQWKNLLHDEGCGKKQSEPPVGHRHVPAALLFVDGTKRSVTGRFPQFTCDEKFLSFITHVASNKIKDKKHASYI